MGTTVICWNMIGKYNMKEFMLKRQLSLVQMDEVQHDAAVVVAGSEKDGDEDDDVKNESITRPNHHLDHQYILIANRPQRQQLLSSQYITLGTFFAFHQA